MNRKRISRSSEPGGLYRDYRKDVNILDLSWVLECREVRVRRRTRRCRRARLVLWFAGLILMLWLLVR